MRYKIGKIVDNRICKMIKLDSLEVGDFFEYDEDMYVFLSRFVFDSYGNRIHEEVETFNISRGGKENLLYNKLITKIDVNIVIEN